MAKAVIAMRSVVSCAIISEVQKIGVDLRSSSFRAFIEKVDSAIPCIKPGKESQRIMSVYKRLF